jgi:hypothetical protein
MDSGFKVSKFQIEERSKCIIQGQVSNLPGIQEDRNDSRFLM